MKKEYVVGFCFDEAFDNVLLIRKNRPDWQKGYLNGIGGKIEDFDEYQFQPTSAMIREFKEETAVDSSIDDWFFYNKEDFEDASLFIFYCVNNNYFKNAKTITDEEIVKVKLLDLTDNELILNNTMEYIRGILTHRLIYKNLIF